ncbi:MAG TPA: hypothetical protein PK019_22390 [Sedimentisphaerales bacterium]|jgi:hypothetical protein|nr:hypothetical protein [Sedimentisphaerales bacterium]
MMGKAPAFQFYPNDWLGDAELSMCSFATRGIWITMICRMWYAKTRGQLSGTREQLCRLLGCTAAELDEFLRENSVTKFADVTECNESVTVINRRMREDDKSRNNGKLRVRRHREKRACNAKVTPPSSTSISTTTPYGRSSNGDDDGNGQVGAVPVSNPHFEKHTRTLIDTWNIFAEKKVSPAEEMAVDREYVPLITGVPPNRFTPEELLGAVENYRHALAVPHSQAHHHTLAGFFQRGTFRKYCPGVYNPEHFDSSPHKKTGRDRDMKAEMEAYYAAKSGD